MTRHTLLVAALAIGLPTALLGSGAPKTSEADTVVVNAPPLEAAPKQTQPLKPTDELVISRTSAKAVTSRR